MPSLSLVAGTRRPDLRRAREGSVWHDLDGSVCGRSYLHGDVRVLDWQDAGLFAFSAHSDVVRVWPARGKSFQEAAQEFDRSLRGIVLQALNWQALHAGAVRTPNGALLFCGRSGSGKSTLSYALSVSGQPQLADDQVVWRLETGEPVVRPLAFEPRLRPRARQFFADRPVAPAPAPSHQAAEPILAICLLEQLSDADGVTEIVRVPAAHAFPAVLPHAHCFDASAPDATRRFANDYLTLVERVPVFKVSYAPDLARLPELAERILAAVDAARPLTSVLVS